MCRIYLGEMLQSCLLNDSEGFQNINFLVYVLPYNTILDCMMQRTSDPDKRARIEGFNGGKLVNNSLLDIGSETA